MKNLSLFEVRSPNRVENPQNRGNLISLSGDRLGPTGWTSSPTGWTGWSQPVTRALRPDLSLFAFLTKWDSITPNFSLLKDF